MPHLADDPAFRAGEALAEERLELPDPDGDRLLEVLAKASDCPGLGYAEAPRRLGSGGEAVVDAFRLSGAPAGFAGPLVLRRILPLKDPDQVDKEAVVHAVLAEAGFPVPRVLCADSSPTALGSPYLVMEALPGRILLQEMTRTDEFVGHPARIPRLVHDALRLVPRVIGETQARLHRLDAEPLRRRFSDAGLEPEEIGFAGRLERMAERIDAYPLDGLRPGLEWLRTHHPTREREVICHGDFVFTNICVDDGRVSGVFDWSSVALAEPAYDVAATLSRFKSNVPGLPPLLARITRAVQGMLVRRYLSWYRRSGSVAPERVRYYEAYWLLHEFVWSGERLRAGAVADDAIEHRWLHPATLDRGIADFEALTGVRLEPLRPEKTA